MIIQVNAINVKNKFMIDITRGIKYYVTYLYTKKMISLTENLILENSVLLALFTESKKYNFLYLEEKIN